MTWDELVAFFEWRYRQVEYDGFYVDYIDTRKLTGEKLDNPKLCVDGTVTREQFEQWTHKETR